MEEITAYVTQSARKATPIGKATTQGEVLGTADTAEFDSAVMKSALKSFMGEIQPKVKELVGKADFSCDEAKKATWKKRSTMRLKLGLNPLLELGLTSLSRRHSNKFRMCKSHFHSFSPSFKCLVILWRALIF